MRELSLFTGAGGGLLGTHLLGWTPVGYVEFEDYPQRVLKARIEDGILPNAPIFGDIRTFISEGYARRYRGMVDVITAGFPCQPYSTAARGRNKKEKDMLPETIQAIKIIRPQCILLENVSRKAIDSAEKQIQLLGYKTRKAKLSASDLGADHVRRRYWLLGYSDNNGQSMRSINDEACRLQTIKTSVWKYNPENIRVHDGMAHRVDRLKAIGNGQVPAVAQAAWELLSQAPIKEDR